jgi:MFS family permease
MREFFSFDPKLLFYGFAIIFFASYGQTFFISIFNAEIRNFYELSDGQFGLVYALGTVSSSLILVGFAKLIDHMDLRIYSFIISLGLAIACLGVYILYNSVVFLFFIIFALRFFGQGAMSHAGETTMARYFGKNRGKAISVSTFGGMIGVMILPLIVVYLTKIIGWQHVWLVSSLSILIFFLPLLFLALQDQNIRHSNFTESIKGNEENKRWKTREVIVDTKFYVYLPLSIATSFINTGLTFHQIFIINQKGWTLDMLAGSFVFLGIFSIIGLIFGGPIIDKYNTKKIILFALLPLFLGILTLIFFDSHLSMLVYMSLLGLNLGIGAPFIGSLWAELYGLGSLGSVKALLHAFMVFASALSPVIFGYIIDAGFGIVTISVISLAIIIVSTLLPIFYRHIE